jgi:hypothetical protein
MSFKADSVEVVEFEGFEVLQREGNSAEVQKFAKEMVLVEVELSKVLLQAM